MNRPKKTINENQKNGLIVNCFHDNADAGFGDFLRGSINLLNHCKSKKLDFDININNHRIKKYFEPIKSKNKLFKINDLALKANLNRPFIHSLKKYTEEEISSTSNCEIKYIFSNYHPCLVDNIDTIKYLNSMPPMNDRCCSWFKNKLQFTQEVNDAVNEKLESQKLKPGKFNVLHFRLGDKNSFGDKDKEIKKIYKKCLFECFLKSAEDDKPIVVLSDSNELKSYILEKNNEMPIHILHLKSNHMQKKPSRFSGEIEISDDDLFHAVLDMKLVTLSSSVESHSVYSHGSGFVYWLAKIFSIKVKLNFL